jgi:hypothetical protein
MRERVCLWLLHFSDMHTKGRHAIRVLCSLQLMKGHTFQKTRPVSSVARFSYVTVDAFRPIFCRIAA